jgi:hypothetical protein
MWTPSFQERSLNLSEADSGLDRSDAADAFERERVGAGNSSSYVDQGFRPRLIDVI